MTRAAHGPTHYRGTPGHAGAVTAPGRVIVNCVGITILSYIMYIMYMFQPGSPDFQWTRCTVTPGGAGVTVAVTEFPFVCGAKAQHGITE